MPRKCLVCASDAGLQCKQCQGAVYCSKICQRIDWKAGHYQACKFIGANESKPAKKKTMQKEPYLARIRLELLDIASKLEDLLKNPPQRRSDDFMTLLQEIQIKLKTVLQTETTMRVSETLVPEVTYRALLESAANAARELATRVNETDEFSINDLHDLEVAVNYVVIRVRAILLNPGVWLQRYDPDSYLSKVPEDIVRYMAEKQKPLEIVRPEASPWTMRRFDEMENEGPPVVSENTIYRIFENNIRIITNGISQTVQHPAWRAQTDFKSGLYVPGLHGTLWQWGRDGVSNFRYNNTWQMIQSVKIPTLMKPIGVDMKNRLWLIGLNSTRIAVVRTDNISPTPQVVAWDTESKLISPTITAIGLAGVFSDSQKLVIYDVDDDNKYTVRYLDTLPDVLALALTDRVRRASFQVLIVGDRASTQISVLYVEHIYNVNSQHVLWIHDLLTNVTHTHNFMLDIGDFITFWPMRATVNNDGRSIFVWCYIDRPGPGITWTDCVFRLSA